MCWHSKLIDKNPGLSTSKQISQSPNRGTGKLMPSGNTPLFDVLEKPASLKRATPQDCESPSSKRTHVEQPGTSSTDFETLFLNTPGSQTPPVPFTKETKTTNHVEQPRAASTEFDILFLNGLRAQTPAVLFTMETRSKTPVPRNTPAPRTKNKTSATTPANPSKIQPAAPEKTTVREKTAAPPSPKAFVSKVAKKTAATRPSQTAKSTKATKPLVTLAPKPPVSKSIDSKTPPVKSTSQVSPEITVKLQKPDTPATPVTPVNPPIAPRSKSPHQTQSSAQKTTTSQLVSPAKNMTSAPPAQTPPHPPTPQSTAPSKLIDPAPAPLQENVARRTNTSVEGSTGNQATRITLETAAANTKRTDRTSQSDTAARCIGKDPKSVDIAEALLLKKLDLQTLPRGNSSPPPHKCIPTVQSARSKDVVDFVESTTSLGIVDTPASEPRQGIVGPPDVSPFMSPSILRQRFALPDSAPSGPIGSQTSAKGTTTVKPSAITPLTPVSQESSTGTPSRSPSGMISSPAKIVALHLANNDQQSTEEIRSSQSPINADVDISSPRITDDEMSTSRPMSPSPSDAKIKRYLP